jgi:hypothetical protein
MMIIDHQRRILTPTLLAFSLSYAAGLVGMGDSNPIGSVDDQSS